MNGTEHAKSIINLVKSKNTDKLPEAIESFQKDCSIRRYANAKLMKVDTRTYVTRTFQEIKTDLKLFKEELSKNSAGDMFYSNEDAILNLIAHRIVPEKVVNSNFWLEQMRDFFSNTSYNKITSKTDNTKQFIENNSLLQKYLKQKHLKGLNVFFLPIKHNNRGSSAFYYDNAIAIYNWSSQNITPVFRETLSQVGRMYYIPVILNGSDENIQELFNLKEDLINLSGNENIRNLEMDTFFSDMFSLHVISSEESYLTENKLGAIWHLIRDNKEEVIDKINTFFENLVPNNKKIKMPDLRENITFTI